MNGGLPADAPAFCSPCFSLPFVFAAPARVARAPWRVRQLITFAILISDRSPDLRALRSMNSLNSQFQSSSSSKRSNHSAADNAAPSCAALSSGMLDKAAEKKARKLERRRLRAELGVPSSQQQQQQQQAILSEEERANRKAAKRARQTLARAETATDCKTGRFEASSVGFHSHMTPAVASSHPFHVTDERDHAETPFEA